MGYERSAGRVIAVVDHDVAVREQLAATLGRACFQVLTYRNGGTFLQAARHSSADCVLLDMHLSDRTGLELLPAITGAAHPAPVIMTSDRASIPMVVSVIKAGAFDVLEKPFDDVELIAAVREAVRCRPRPTSRRAALLHLIEAAELTTPEIEVLEQLAAGRSNKEIGLMLRISPHTVEVHRARAMEKLKVRTTADLMRVLVGSLPPSASQV